MVEERELVSRFEIQQGEVIAVETEKDVAVYEHPCALEIIQPQFISTDEVTGRKEFLSAGNAGLGHLRLMGKSGEMICTILNAQLSRGERWRGDGSHCKELRIITDSQSVIYA
jgi:hypothetical protein